MNDWIEWTWTEEKQYPENLDTLVITKRRDGHGCHCEEDYEPPMRVGWWHGDGSDYRSNWRNYNHGITHYKVIG